MDIAVTGSLAFDHIMSFEGCFEDHILPDKIHTLNVSFLVNGFEKRRGGCAANIAYACALHDLDVGIVGCVGHDFEDYGAWLEARGIDLSAVAVHKDLHTASCFITTDRKNNQITGFYPGAMAHAKDLSLKKAELGSPQLVVISPNAPDAMTLYPGECRELGVDFMYDPGQQVIALDGEQLKDGLHGAKIVIANDYELATIQKKTGIDKIEGLLEFAEIVVVTLGEKGSVIHHRGGDSVTVPVAPVSDIKDPTGCGDAYRGGFMAGLQAGADLATCGRLGALTAAYCIEVQGTSEYSFSKESFAERYESAFGAALSL